MAAPAPHTGLSADDILALPVAADEHVECLDAARTTRCSLKQLEARVVEILVAHWMGTRLQRRRVCIAKGCERNAIETGQCCDALSPRAPGART